MEFFLPVAQVQVNILIIIFLSFCVGFISGLFGIGGGFLMTPILIFLGIPPTFAVANEANNILGVSVSGALTHWFRKTLDYKMGIRRGLTSNYLRIGSLSSFVHCHDIVRHVDGLAF